MGAGGTLMMEWERRLGAAVDQVKPFLKLTGEAVEDIACPGSSDCGCRHHVSETRKGKLLAFCQCRGEEEGAYCETFQVEREDLLVHSIDWHLFADEIRKALGFAEPTGAAYVGRELREIGTYAAVAAPVYLCLAGEDVLLRELVKLQGLREGPFLVVTATGSTWSPEVEALARPHGGGHISLSSVLIPEGRQFKEAGELQPMLEEFGRRLGSRGRIDTVVQKIGEDLRAIATGTAELRRENQELKEMQGAGLFKFALRVNGEDFQAFAAVMALGNRRAAAAFLNVPVPTFYRRTDSWKTRGKDYQRMHRLVEWRKASGRKMLVRLEDSVLSGDGESAENPETIGAVLAKMRADGSDSRSYPDLLRQVFEALQVQNAGNWAEVRQELVNHLKEEV
jgi:hypothetical protein